MQIELPDLETHTLLQLRDERLLDDDRYFEFCMRNPNLRIERDASGQITIMPPTGLETGYRSSSLSAQLYNWAESDGRGISADSSTEYLLHSGAAYSPDASWVSNTRLADLTTEQKKDFLIFALSSWSN